MRRWFFQCNSFC